VEESSFWKKVDKSLKSSSIDNNQVNLLYALIEENKSLRKEVGILRDNLYEVKEVSIKMKTKLRLTCTIIEQFNIECPDKMICITELIKDDSED